MVEVIIKNSTKKIESLVIIKNGVTHNFKFELMEDLIKFILYDYSRFVEFVEKL